MTCQRQIFMLLLMLSTSDVALSQATCIRQEGITDAADDLQGNLYISTKDGGIVKFDSTFHELISYTAEKTIPVTSIDVANRFRIFGFYRNDQSYIILDQLFRKLNENSFDPRIIGSGVAACLAADEMIWIFDELDFSLKKLNPSLNQIVINVKMPLVTGADHYSIIQLETYQNRLYVNNSADGVYVFDGFGNFLKKLKISTNHFFHIFREELFYIDHSTVKTIHIYTHEIEIVPGIKDIKGLLTTLINAHQALLVYPDSVCRVR
jgi:hypothetical protein